MAGMKSKYHYIEEKYFYEKYTRRKKILLQEQPNNRTFSLTTFVLRRRYA